MVEGARTDRRVLPQPRRAPDLLAVIDEAGSTPRKSWSARGGLAQDIRIVRHELRAEGLTGTATAAFGRVRRVLKR